MQGTESTMQTSNVHHHDDIALIDLFFVLFKERFIVSLTTVMFALASIV